MKKNGIRKIIPWVILGIIAILLGLMPIVARNAAGKAEASVLSVTAETGTIETTLAGGGTLSAEDPIEVSLPETVEVEEFLVENGEHVEEGQPLALVDRVTLLGALTEIQQSLDEVALQMKEQANTATITKLTAPVAGRVKAVYAEVGKEAKQTMLEHGALAVISLDGLMAVEIRTNLPVRAGEALTVRLSSGKELPGRVETELEGMLSITLTDDGTGLGDTVTVFRDDGTEVGSGTLSVHNAWNLLATDGTVNYIYVRENQMIWLGGGIVSLQNPGGNTEYRTLAAKHRDYEEMMQELFALYGDNTVKAPSAGFVSGIDKTKIKNTAAGDRKAEIKLLADETVTGSTTMLVNGVNGNVINGISVAADLDFSDLTGLLALLSSGNTSVTLSDECVKDYGVPSVGDVILITYTEDIPTSWTLIQHVDITGLIDGAKKAEEAIKIPQIPSVDISGLMGGFNFQMPSVPKEGEEDDGLYNLEETVILSVTPDDAMTVSIDVDELDILVYELGMAADVTVDALPDRSFTAEVTEISGMGENSGGNSKYSVKLRLDRAPDMLDGMNASVVVHRDEKTALLLPAEAIYDRGSRSYVCTALENKTGKPAVELPVTTGVSDGRRVEILSGLSEGQTVFYEYYLPPENTAS